MIYSFPPLKKTSQNTSTHKTTLFYKRNHIPYVVDISWGPGGIIELDEDETDSLLESVDIRHRYGLIEAQLTTTQLEGNEVLKAIVNKHTQTIRPKR